MAKKVKIKLDEMDAALVFRRDNEIEVVIPVGDINEEVPAHILTVVAIGTLLQECDKAFSAIIAAKMDALCEKEDEEDDDEEE